MLAHTLNDFADGVKAVAAYLAMMGRYFDPRKCAIATREGVAGLRLCLWPHRANALHWVPAAGSVPYLGLQLQPDGEFS